MRPQGTLCCLLDLRKGLYCFNLGHYGGQISAILKGYNKTRTGEQLLTHYAIQSNVFLVVANLLAKGEYHGRGLQSFLGNYTQRQRVCQSTRHGLAKG